MQSIGLVRPASAQDAAACVAIYRPYVLDTAISWEIEVPTVEEMAARIAAARENHEWLVVERDDRVVGFAYGQTLKRLASFRWSAESGLYTRLLRRLTERGYRQAFAGITQPNAASNGFHRSFGFEEAGLYRRVEWKHGRWHDVAWMQLDLVGSHYRADPEAPPDPIA
jgi:L-amino acid N-acyltransferase YncA